MLSFIKEQGSENKQPQNSAGGVNEIDQQQEFFTVATKKKTARKSTILLTALFVVGLLCLFIMIKKSTPKVASASEAKDEEARIEQTISRLTGIKSQMFSRLDEVIKKFYELSEVKQVNVDELSKNPFKLEMLAETKNYHKEADGITPEFIKQSKLNERAQKIQLFSIMQSDHGSCCMMDDKILYENDTINEFTVSQIGSDFVKLESEGTEVILKLSE